MRRVKFKAILEKESIIRDVLGIDFLNLKVLVSISGSHEWHKYKKLLQYTGLEDENGTEIYEGDIYTQGCENIRYIVVFNDCQFVGKQVENRSLAGLTYFSDEIEVIGNIYENPELLEIES